MATPYRFLTGLTVLITSALMTRGDAQSIRAPVEAAFQGCGLRLARDPQLDRMAAAYARLGKVRLAAAEVRYAYQKAQGIRVDGDLPYVLSSIRSHCNDFQELIAYGIAPFGRGHAIVVADPKIPPGLQGASTEGKKLLAATNAARARGAKCGGKPIPPAPALAWDDRLFAAAQVYAQRMAKLNFTGHVDPYTGADVGARVQQAGFRGSVGENLQHGGNTAELAVQRLLTSPGHCMNLMDPGWTVMGGAYAAAETSDYGIHWVQLFGRP